jgi:hypothetical protein
MPSQGFFNKRFNVGERVLIGEGGKAIRTDNSIYFGLSLFLHIRE